MNIPPRLVGAALTERLRTMPAVIVTGARQTGTSTLADASNIRVFRAEYGSRARAGLVLHTGNRLEWLTPDVLAAPVWRVL